MQRILSQTDHPRISKKRIREMAWVHSSLLQAPATVTLLPGQTVEWAYEIGKPFYPDRIFHHNNRRRSQDPGDDVSARHSRS